ncbi:gamma-glutamylcyclotransferase family protein [Enterovibrio norvegicus]|uniref:Gamma-glutamylcyclotransferase n=1 Tax=Enterovibrio norvegicus TaxID=188144 RepID=A0A2N7L8Q3_9GAMM|nr:gamma-glutamylcyclotransferase family protein [Enterovibrio norvegicus]PMN90674.1 hypothetical protein BCT23_04090 [Enterovibrio norvegicus]
MFYYFAYGSCMNLASLSDTLGVDVKTHVLGLSYLNDYKLKFNYPSIDFDYHYCNIAQAPNRRVEGTLFLLPDSALEPLREREEYWEGRYDEIQIQVTCDGKTYHDVLTYQAKAVADEEIFPGERYLGLLEQGLFDAQVSEQYHTEVMRHINRLHQEYKQTQVSAGPT